MVEIGERLIAAARPQRPDFSFLTGWEAVLVPMLMIDCGVATISEEVELVKRFFSTKRRELAEEYFWKNSERVYKWMNRAAKDWRINTVVALNSSFPTAAAPGIVGGTEDGWTAEKLAIPAAIFTGGLADSGFSGAEQCYKALGSTLPVLKASLNTVGHTGAYPMPDLRWSSAVLAWLDWQLKGDRQAVGMFAGPDCAPCKDADWWIEARNIP